MLLYKLVSFGNFFFLYYRSREKMAQLTVVPQAIYSWERMVNLYSPYQCKGSYPE
jgi:hypothetical protein